MTEMQVWRKMVALVEENGGTYRQGNSWDTIWFDGSNHKEVSTKVFNECKQMGANVYGLVQIDAWKDEHNDVKDQSYFNYK